MTGAFCIALPLCLAVVLPWLPAARWLTLGAAALDLVAAASMPWTGSSLGGWLLPDPLAVLVLVLAGFAWVTVSAAASVPRPVLTLIGLVNLALLADGAGLTAIAAGGAGVASVLALRLPTPGPLLRVVVAGAGLAVFGIVLLYVGTVPALGPGWPALSWSALPEAGSRSIPTALSAGFVLVLLGSGISCLAVPLWSAGRAAALPAPLASLAGPLGGVWLVVALRLRGVLDGSGQAIAPGGVLLAAGLAGLAVALACLRRPAALLAASLLAVFATVLIGFGLGGPAATEAALLHLALGCLALTAAAGGSRVGFAALSGLPPLGVFASGFALTADAAAGHAAVAVLLASGLFGVAALALRGLPQASGSPLGWIGVGLALVGAWAMPPALAAWLQGIAAAAR